MRKITIIGAIIAGFLFVWSCQKEDTVINKPSTNYSLKTSQEEIADSIKKYIDMVDSARVDQDYSEETFLTLDEGVWNTEALINYIYADASTTFEFYHLDTSYFTYDVEGTSIMLKELVNLLDEVSDSLESKYEAIEDEDKLLVLADVELDWTNGSQARFVVTAGFGRGTIESFFEDFDPSEDNWTYGGGQHNSGGICSGPLQGYYTNLDAADQIELKRNYRISIPTYHSYFVSISQVFVSGGSANLEYVVPSGTNISCTCCDLLNPDDQTANDNIQDFLLYHNFSGWSNFDYGCITGDNMNFYLDGLHDVIYDIAFDCFTQLDDKSFIAIELYDDATFGGPPNWDTEYFHSGIIQYGISMQTSNPVGF